MSTWFVVTKWPEASHACIVVLYHDCVRGITSTLYMNSFPCAFLPVLRPNIELSLGLNSTIWSMAIGHLHWAILPNSTEGVGTYLHDVTATDFLHVASTGF